MGADVLATQGASASAIMIFTMLNRINSISRYCWKACKADDVGFTAVDNTGNDAGEKAAAHATLKGLKCFSYWIIWQ